MPRLLISKRGAGRLLGLDVERIKVVIHNDD
jgi:hypothetical protein